MIFSSGGLKSFYEIEMLVRMLFPVVTLKPLNGLDENEEDEYIRVEVVKKDEGCEAFIKIKKGDSSFSVSVSLSGSENELVETIAREVYTIAQNVGAPVLRWGTLTGIRPVKLFHMAREAGFSDDRTINELKQRFLASDEMLELCRKIADREKDINDKSLPNGFSLYISIPFCPQRCSYCSFVSQSVEKQQELIEPYVNKLCEELFDTAQIANRLGLRLQTIYFGGGTPTTLSATQLEKIFLQIAHCFDLKDVLEYTVEAGRPDTIDEEKLLAMKRAGVGRISVNPQTMNDSILREIDRFHSSEDVVKSFMLARHVGFGSINMDLIAGLKGETPQSFENSLKRVLALSPDNITVHTLTIKRSSDIYNAENAQSWYKNREATAQMIDTARKLICDEDYNPYYLYRQKNSVGSLDNTGYSRPGCEGFYNVFIMDETQTILAVGAGAVTKLVSANSKKLERIYNFKYPREYLLSYQELKKRKEGIVSFYESDKQA